MNRNIHYSGLTDAQVIESRRESGANVMTPPPEMPLRVKLLRPFRFWLVKTVLSLLVISVMTLSVLKLAGVAMIPGIFVAPLILSVLLLVIYAVSFMGGAEDPMIAILLVAILLSGALSLYQGVFCGEKGLAPYLEPLGISAAVLLATMVSFILERSNAKTFRSLNQVNDNIPVKTIRNDNVCQIPRKDIVVGDVVLLETGEEVPADCELLDSFNLIVNESTLTGEMQCAKSADPEHFDIDATYPSNNILKGCTVVDGYCTARVFAVGDYTASGQVFTSAQIKDGESTPLSDNLDSLAGTVARLSYLAAALVILGRVTVLIVSGSFSGDAVGLVKYLLNTVMIAVTLIVVAVPEGLPMAVTLSLAFSMKRLMKQNTLPRTMHACETMGAASVICTDKTGTLTQNIMRVNGTMFDVPSDMMFESIAVNTTANLDFSDTDKPSPVGNPTEGALLMWIQSRGVDYLSIREGVAVIDRLPFTTESKYMATAVRSKVSGSKMLYVKGAPEILLSLCGASDADRARYADTLKEWQERAMRTLGFACAVLEDDTDPFSEGRLDVTNLQMMGIVAISDPIREEVPQAIRDCVHAGIKVKMVTGDNSLTAKEIGRQVGIWGGDDTEADILSGSEIEMMSDDDLDKRIDRVKIISRARPADKERVVKSLERLGYIVAVTGDGTNDAPALNAANVGLSMGDGTAVAKEASDMTILDNSFGTIANAVMWGRSLFKNIKRFVLFQMTVNLAACLIVLTGAFTGTESPLTVTQMLWVNLIMDTFAALALASLPPDPSVMDEKPRNVKDNILKGIGRPIVFTGLSFTVILTALLEFFRYSGYGEGLSAYELTLFFTIFVMLQFWNLFNAKAYMTGRSAFSPLSIRETGWFIIIAAVILIGQIVIVQFGGNMFGVIRGGLKLFDWAGVILITSVVLWVGEIGRNKHRR